MLPHQGTAPVAQMGERAIRNRQVPRSNRGGGFRYCVSLAECANSVSVPATLAQRQSAHGVAPHAGGRWFESVGWPDNLLDVVSGCGGGSTDGDVPVGRKTKQRDCGRGPYRYGRRARTARTSGFKSRHRSTSGQNRPATYFSAFPEQMECQGVRQLSKGVQ